MKIQITGGGHDLNLSLPTRLLSSRFLLRMVLKKSGLAENLEGLSPEAANKLAVELNSIKKRHGHWELVEVQSARGEQIKIIL